LAYVTISTHLPQRLIDFYRALMGNEVTFEAAPYTVLGGGPTRPVCVAFQQVAEGQSNTPVHLDFHVPDVEAAAQRVIQLGGTVGDRHEEVGSVWRQAFDPDGNVFCLMGAAEPSS
jgi:predicted enzyme related to lactoylglutathione lyase